MNIGFIILAYASLVTLSLIDNGRGAAYPEILSGLSISTDKGSYLFTIASLAGLMANLTGRYWLAFLGLVNGTRMALLLMGVGSLVLGFAGEFSSYPLLLFAACLTGLGLGSLGITMNVMVSEGAPVDKRRQYLSGLHGVYGISSFLAPHILTLIIFNGGSWIVYFKYISLVSILVILYSLKVVDTHREEVSSESSALPMNFSKRTLIGLYFGFYVASEIIISSRLPLYLIRVQSFSQSNANAYLSYFFLGLMCGRLFFAFVKVKTANYKLIVASFSMTFICYSLGIWLHPIFLCLCGLTMSFCFPISMDWLKERFHSGNHVMVASVMATIGITLTIMHWLFGQITNSFGIEVAFQLFYIFNVLGLVIFVLFDKIDISD